MPSNEISIENIVLILRMHLRLIMATLALGIFIAVIVTSQMPEMYRATTSLNFEFSSNNPLEDRESRSLAQESYLITQIGLLTSLNVAQYVVDNLSDYQQKRLLSALYAKANVFDEIKRGLKKFFDSFEEDKSNGGSTAGGSRETLDVAAPYDGLARWIGGDLEVTPVFNSRIVDIAYYSTNAKIATLMANKYAEAYIAKNLKMITDPAHSKKVWFDEQLKSLRVRLEDAQARLTAYQQQEGIVSSGGRIDLETTRLEQLSAQLIAAQQASRNAQTMRQKLNAVVNSGASLITFAPVFENNVVQKVRAEIRELDGRLIESSSSLGDNHPTIVTLKSELKGAKSRLNTEIRSITEGIINAEDLAKQRELDIADAMEKQKLAVLNLKSEHDSISVLQREVESARTTYNAALSQLNTASMLSMVNQTNVSIVDYATVPSRSASPKVAKNLAIGAFGGLLLGVGISLFIGLIVRRIHTEDDLVNGIGIPLLGHLKS